MRTVFDTDSADFVGCASHTDSFCATFLATEDTELTEKNETADTVLSKAEG